MIHKGKRRSYLRLEGWGGEAATADYVGFVDGDDWVDADMFESLLASAESHDADMAICGLVYDYEDSSREKTVETSRLSRESMTGRPSGRSCFRCSSTTAPSLDWDDSGGPGDQAVPHLPGA